MAKVAVFLLGVFNFAPQGQLKFALDFSHEEKVDEDIIVIFVQPILDPDYLQYLWIFQVDFLQDFDGPQKFVLAAGMFAPQQVSDLEGD